MRPGPPSIALLLLLLVALPLLSQRTARSGRMQALPRPALYVSAALTQWLIVPLLVVVMVAEGFPASAIGLVPLPPAALFRWSAITLAICLAVGFLALLLRRLLGVREAPLVQHLMPRT